MKQPYTGHSFLCICLITACCRRLVIMPVIFSKFSTYEEQLIVKQTPRRRVGVSNPI